MTTKLTVLSPQDIKNAYMRVVRAELIARGVQNPNVTAASDYAVRAEALAQQLAPCMANAVIAADLNMPDTAIGDRLVRWLTRYGLTFRSAQPSSGYVVLSSTANAFIPFGSQLVDAKGAYYKVDFGQIYSNGDQVPITAVSKGAATNLRAGDVLRWMSPPAYVSPKAVVSTGGLVNGSDADTVEQARARLLARMKFAQGGGNAAQTIAWAEEVSAGVSAFDYPALNGPSTYGLWCLGQLTYTGTRFTRQISDSLRSQISDYVTSQKPEHAHLTMPDLGSEIVDDAADVSIGLTLPDAVSAGGSGGGWIDQTPWPVLAGTATRVYVSNKDDNLRRLLLTSNDPTTTPDPSQIVDGVTKISWFDPTTFNNGSVRGSIKTATITSHSGSVGSVYVYIDAANYFAGISVGDYVFPACNEAETYAQAWFTSLAEMGPGEWTSDAARLVNCRRRPLPTERAPHSLTSRQLRSVEQSSELVYNATYLYRSVSVPTVPANTTTVAPHVIVPGRKLGFYRVTS